MHRRTKARQLVYPNMKCWSAIPVSWSDSFLLAPGEHVSGDNSFFKVQDTIMMDLFSLNGYLITAEPFVPQIGFATA